MRARSSSTLASAAFRAAWAAGEMSGQPVVVARVAAVGREQRVVREVALPFAIEERVQVGDGIGRRGAAIGDAASAPRTSQRIQRRSGTWPGSGARRSLTRDYTL